MIGDKLFIKPSPNQAPLGLAAAQPVVRAQQGDQRDQDDRVLQVLSQRWVLGRRPSSNNKPRHQRQGQGSPVPLQEQGPSNNSQPRDKAWAWGQTKLNLVKWVQQVDPWGRQGRQVLKEIHHPQW